MQDAPPVTPLLSFHLREPHRGEPQVILTGAIKYSPIAVTCRQRAVPPGWGNRVRQESRLNQVGAPCRSRNGTSA